MRRSDRKFLSLCQWRQRPNSRSKFSFLFIFLFFSHLVTRISKVLLDWVSNQNKIIHGQLLGSEVNITGNQLDLVFFICIWLVENLTNHRADKRANEKFGEGLFEVLTWVLSTNYSQFLTNFCYSCSFVFCRCMGIFSTSAYSQRTHSPGTHHFDQ